MPKTVIALMLLVVTLAPTGLAATTGLTANPVSEASVQSTTGPTCQAARQALASAPARAVVHWERSYDRHGNPLPGGPQENVGTDSLYFKNYYSLTALLGSPKSEVPNPTPESCGPAFAWQLNQTSVGMDPFGNYCYEVYSTTLRRTSTADGSHTDYTIGHGYWACGTDGSYVYAPVGDTVFKYTLTGTLVSSTLLDVTPTWYEFSVANDTVWCAPGDSILHGYACSKFSGGSITTDATWNVGAGTNTPALVGWDGRYYYVSWDGQTSNTFKRFNADRTLSASGMISIDTRGVMCKRGSYGVKVCHGSWHPSYLASLRQMLLDSCGGKFAAVDTYDISLGAHATFPATEWYDGGYRAILVFTDDNPQDSIALGDSLARFIQLGGGVVEAVFADQPKNDVRGEWRSVYAPFSIESTSYSAGSMGTVHQPLHPIMTGVSALTVGSFRTGNKPGTLRSANCVSLAEYTDNNCVATCFDSAGQRAVSLGTNPEVYWLSSASGQWCRLMVNALNWTAVGPSVGVTAPNGGETWDAGTVHNITWTQTANGVSDSIYYSTDGGSSWIGVTWFAAPPSPLQYAWTVPNTPSTQARVKVVTRDADGGRVEDASDADFTIAPPMALEQPRNSALPLVFALHQPHPNPLASGAQIRYDLPRPTQVELRIYDVSGTLVRRLAGGAQTAGYRSAYWNGTDSRGRTVAPGVYYCRFTAGDFRATQKLAVRR
ncbi:MAG TPA: FlgD immunoglobulin-like domain containing protein [bacterium]|nr:FlgD immunoglobulin-like domain containing protein [bacterium]